MGLFRGIKDTFFGGAEKQAANDQIRFSQTAEKPIDDAARFANSNLEPIANATRQTINPLISTALDQSTPVQVADFERVAGTPRNREFVEQFASEVRDGPDSRIDDALRDRVLRGDQGVATGTLRDFIASDPGGDFAREEGFDAIQRSAAAGGKLQSGQTLRDLTRFNSGLNAERRGQRLNEILALSDVESRGRAQGISELLSASDVSARGRASRLNEISAADALRQGARDSQLSDLAARASSANLRNEQRFNRLFDVARFGAGGIEGQNRAFQGAANDFANLRLGQGNARAAGRIGSANAKRGTIFDLAKLGFSL